MFRVHFLGNSHSNLNSEAKRPVSLGTCRNCDLSEGPRLPSHRPSPGPPPGRTRHDAPRAHSDYRITRKFRASRAVKLHRKPKPGEVGDGPWGVRPVRGGGERGEGPPRALQGTRRACQGAFARGAFSSPVRDPDPQDKSDFIRGLGVPGAKTCISGVLARFHTNPYLGQKFGNKMGRRSGPRLSSRLGPK
jgi:hypothetical protein